MMMICLGYSNTELQGHIHNPVYRFFVATVFNRLVAQSAEMGSAPLLMAATDPSVKNGEYYGAHVSALHSLFDCQHCAPSLIILSISICRSLWISQC